VSLKKCDFDGQFLRIQISAYGREFQDAVAIVKALQGVQFLDSFRIWLAAPSKHNLQTLKRHGFQFSFPALGKLDELENADKQTRKLNFTPEQLQRLQGLRHYQLEGVQFLEDNGGTGLIADEMGLGKTVQACGELALHPDRLPALIICKSAAKIHWQREILKWTGQRSTILEGMTPITHSADKIFILNWDILGRETEDSKARRKEVKQLKKTSANPRLIRAVAPEFEGWFKTFLEKIKPAIVIADEIQNISNEEQGGNPVARTHSFTRLIKGLQKQVSGFAFILMSGTPMRKKPAKFFTVLNLLAPKTFSSRWAYYHRYCGAKHNGFSWTFDGASHVEELHGMLKPLMIRRLKKDVLPELPPKQKIVVPLPPDAKRYAEYLHAENDYVDFVSGWDDGKGASKAGRYFALKHLAYWVKRDSVISWMRDFIEDNGKLVIFAKHHVILDDIQSEFKNAVRVDGNVTGAKRQAAIDAFQTDPKVELFIGQIMAAGDSITLTAANAVAFVEMPDSGEDIDQAGDRVHRIGQEADAVFSYFLIAPDTIEEDAMPILLESHDNVNKVLNGETDSNLFGDYSRVVERLAEKYKKRGKRK